jgi:hypothetical protein
MKIQFNKVMIHGLKKDQLHQIHGGDEALDDSEYSPEGQARSDRLNGNCNFSRKHGMIMQTDSNGVNTSTGCYTPCK